MFCRASIQILQSLAHHINSTKQGAFTLTGPYGTGKSSLAFLMSLLSENKAFRKKAAEKINLKDDESIKRLFLQEMVELFL